MAWVCLLLGVVSVAGACGKAEGNAGPVSRAELPGRVASFACEGLGGCCKNGGFAFDMAACKQALTTEIEENLSDNLSSNIDYDAQAAGDCLSALSANSRCGEFDDDDAPACERIFRGRLALGQPCNSSDECREGEGQRVVCDTADLSPTVCTLLSSAPARAGQEGEACFTTCFEGDECQLVSAPVPLPAPGPGIAPEPVTEPVACFRDQGLWCDFATGTCARLAAVGQACSGYEACVGDAFCDFNTQLCTAPRPNGEVCEGSEQCQSGTCGDGGPSGAPDPSGAPLPTQVCVSSRTVSAEECAQDFSDDSGGDPVPAPAPGTP